MLSHRNDKQLRFFSNYRHNNKLEKKHFSLRMFFLQVYTHVLVRLVIDGNKVNLSQEEVNRYGAADR